MTSREELIEEAAKAMAILDDYDGCFERLAGTDPEEPLSTDEEDAEFWRKRARVALAVFEKAHTPTDDERYPDAEGIAYFRRTVQGEPSVTVATKPAIDEVRKVLDYYADEIDVHIWQEIASAVDDIPDCETWTAAPHAEHVQGEPTDAQVEAGCVAFYEHASGLTSWSRLVDYDAVLADRYRDGIRRALRAAHDAEKRTEWEAEQGTEEPEWEYGYGSIADAEAERPTMRRRKAGPWVPVDENGSER